MKEGGRTHALDHLPPVCCAQLLVCCSILRVTYMYIYIYIYMHTYAHIHTQKCVCSCACACVQSVYVCACVRVCVCVQCFFGMCYVTIIYTQAITLSQSRCPEREITGGGAGSEGATTWRARSGGERLQRLLSSPLSYFMKPSMCIVMPPLVHTERDSYQYKGGGGCDGAALDEECRHGVRSCLDSSSPMQHRSTSSLDIAESRGVYT